MSMSYPSRRGGSSLTLVVTFVLGLMIGAALFYAVADSMGWDFSARSAQVAKAPVEPAPTPEPEPTPEPAPAEPAPTEPAQEPAPAPVAEPEPVPVASFDVPAEDIAKHLMVDLQGNALDDAAKALLAGVKPGLVVLRTQNLESKESGAKLIAEIKAAVGGEGLGGWPLVAVSQEGGEDNPLFVAEAPTAQRIADEQDFTKATKNARAVALNYAAAARELGVGVVLAPRLDIYDPNVSDAALQARSFGVDAQDIADLGASFQVGMREGGALAVGKHFPGLGQAVKGDDGVMQVPHKEIRLLVEGLLPFTQVVESGIAGILVGQVRVPGLEQAHPELTAAESETILQKVLREQLKFDGVVIADDISSSPATSARPVGEVVAAMLVAGCDVVYLGTLEQGRVDEAVAGVKAAMADGRITQEAWERSAARLEAWRTFLAQPPLATPPKPKAEPVPQPEGTEKKSHKVLRNETLEGLAKEYGVSVDEIAAWNALEDKKIRYGQKLNIYPPKKAEEKPAEAEKPAETKPEEAPKPEETPADAPKPEEAPAAESPKPEEVTADVPKAEEPSAEAPKTKETPTETPKAEEKPANTPAEEKKEAEAAPAPEAPPVETQLHEVVRGDTLRKIAGKYQTTEAVLMKLNKISSPDHVQLGAKLKVPKQP